MAMDPNLNDYVRRIRQEAAALLQRPESLPAEPAANLLEDPSAYTLLLEIEPEAAWVFERRGEACAFLKQWTRPPRIFPAP
jgi:hypothetical protein